MQKLMLKHWKMELGELWRSFNKKAFTQALNKLIPDIKEDYLERKRLSQAPKTWARGVATVKEPVKPKKSGH
jgi:hypothetical protein